MRKTIVFFAVVAMILIGIAPAFAGEQGRNHGGGRGDNKHHHGDDGRGDNPGRYDNRHGNNNYDFDDNFRKSFGKAFGDELGHLAGRFFNPRWYYYQASPRVVYMEPSTRYYAPPPPPTPICYETVETGYYDRWGYWVTTGLRDVRVPCYRY